MSKSKKRISSDKINGWLASTGYLLPTTPQQLANFEKMFEGIDYGLNGNEIDPKKILFGKDIAKKKTKTIKLEFSNEQAYSIAALLSNDDSISFAQPPLKKTKKRRK